MSLFGVLIPGVSLERGLTVKQFVTWVGDLVMELCWRLSRRSFSSPSRMGQTDRCRRSRLSRLGLTDFSSGVQ